MMLINVKRVKHEIELSGKTAAEIAKSIKVDEKIVQSWLEEEDIEVDYEFLLPLAKLFKRPSYYFLIDDDPSGEYTGSFRTLYLQKYREGALSPELTMAIRRSEFIQDRFKKLTEAQEDNVFHQLRELFIDNNEIDASKVAKVLNIKYDYLKRSNPNSGDVYRTWRRAFEARNILITQFSYSTEIARGFCIHDERVPIISANSKEPMTARLFTLLHELGHIIFNNSDIATKMDFIKSDNSEEARCNRFASSILVPHEYLSEKISEFIQPGGEVNIPNISKSFGVSRHVMIIALMKYGYIAEVIAEELIETLEKEYREYRRSLERKKGEFFIPFSVTRSSALGEVYTETVKEMYSNNEISHSDAYELISLDWNLKPSTFKDFMTA
jgi:Zn-dependent peptidase ImmA (M78 family)